MANLKPYTGEVIPLSEEEEKRLTPYSGEILPLDEEDMGSSLEKEVLQRQPMSDRRVGEASTLPPPSDTMYDNLSPDDALALYEAYKKHPDTKTNWLGQAKYKDTPILDPERSEINRGILETGRALKPENFIGGIANAGRNAIGTSLMIGEEIANADPETPLGKAAKAGGLAANTILNPVGAVAGVIPGSQTESFEEAVPEYKADTDLGQFVTGATEFGVGAALGDPMISKAARMLPTGLKTIGKLLGSEVAGTVTMSPETENMIIDNAKKNPMISGIVFDENGEYSRDRLNKKVLQLQEGVLLSAIAGGAFKSGKAVIDMTAIPWYRHLRDFNNKTAEQKEVLSTLVRYVADLPDNATHDELMDAYSEIGSYMKEKEKTIVSLKGVLEGPDLEITNDTVENLIGFLKEKDPKKYADKIETLESFRSSALGGKAPKLNVTLKEGRRALDKSLTDIQDVKEYEKSIPQTTEMFQKKGTEQVEGVKTQVDEAKVDLKREQDTALDPLRQDSAFSKVDDPNIEFNPRKDVERTEDQIGSQTRQNVEGLERTADVEYDKIDPRAKTSKAFRDKFNSLDNILTKDIKIAFGKANGNFRDTVYFVKPKLNAYISELSKDGKNVDLVSQLRELSDELSVSGTPKANQQLAKADVNFREEVGPYRQGLPEKIRKIDQNFKGKPVDIADESRKAIRGTLNSSDSARQQHVRELLKLSKNDNLIDDYYIGNAAVEAKRTLQDTGDISVAQLRKAFEPARTGMSEAGQKRFEKVFNDLESKNKTIKEKTAILEKLEADAKDIEDKVYGEHLSDFFEKKGGSYKKSGKSGYLIFNDIVNAPDGVTKVKKYLENSDETTRNAFQAAWAKSAHDKYFGAKEIANFEKTPQGRNFKDIGVELYGKDIVDSLEVLAEHARRGDAANKARMGSGYDVTRNRTLADKARNAIITFGFGVLNPTAARIRIMTGEAMSTRDSVSTAKEAMDDILSNSETFLSVMEKMKKENRVILDDADKRLLRKVFVPGLRTSAGQEDKKDTEDQTKKIFQK